MIKSLKGKRNFAAVIVEFAKSLLATGKQHKSAVRAEIAGEHCKCDHCVKQGVSADTYTENCVSIVYEKIVRKKQLST